VRRLPLFVVMTVLPLAFARGAGAVEREHQLGVNVGLPLLTIADKSTPDVGAAFGIHYGYGITDQFNFLAELQYSVLALNVFPTDPTTHPAQMLNADVGVTYVLDVLRWVPYFGALAGGYMMYGGTVQPNPLLLPGAEIVVGLDYLVTPKWAVGVELSEHFLFTESTVYTSYSTAFARTEFRWGK
jgi:hypothetical protein